MHRYMEFRKMVTTALYARWQKRHRHLDYVGESERGMIWENSIETSICKIDDQCKFDAWNMALKAGAQSAPW